MMLNPGDIERRESRILVVDDHPIVREGLKLRISQETDLVICAEAENALQALDSIERCAPHIVILDISLGRQDGLGLIKDIRIRYPNLPVLVLSIHSEPLYVERAIRAGANGYVSKHESPDMIVEGIRRVLAGEVYVTEELVGGLVHGLVDVHAGGRRSPVERLSDRELEIFQLMGRGFKPCEIAKELNLSVKTVEGHRWHMRKKLKRKSASELTRFAVEWMQSRTDH